MLPVYCAAWIAGTIAAAEVALPLQLWLVWAALPAGLLLLFRRDPLLLRLHLILLVFIVAAIRYTATLPHFDANTLAYYNDRGSIQMIGTVQDAPEVSDTSARLRVALQRARIVNDWRAVTGIALVDVAREADVRYGDQIEFYAEPETPSESAEFSYKDYLARREIYSVARAWSGFRILARDQGNPFYAALYALRSHAYATIRTLLPEPAASLLAGILLGNDSGIPRGLSDAFSATNTTHIIAISGFNIAIIAGILTSLVRRFGQSRSLTLLVVVMGLVVYTVFVGAGPSVVRAAIMGGLSALALYYRRQNYALNTLAVAALGMAVVQPLVVYDLSFQLSFLATLGLVLFVEPFTRMFEYVATHLLSAAAAKSLVGALGDSLIVTIAAQITTTPLLVYTFHRLSVVGLLANLLVLPAQPAVMIVGGAATIIGMVVQPLGQVIAWVAWAFLQWTILVVQWMASLPLAVVNTGRSDFLLLLAYYMLLFGLARYGRTILSTFRSRPSAPAPLVVPALSLSPALALGGMVVAFIWALNFSTTLPDGRIHVEFLDVAGPATLVRTPGGGRVLIDGGANPSALVAALGERMPFWDRSLDLVVLTDPADHHLAGLVAALERYSVRRIVQVSPPAKPSVAYVKWSNLVAEHKAASWVTQDGVAVQIEDGIHLEVMPGIASSAVTRVEAGGTSILVADGLDEEAQAAWLASGSVPKSAVLVPPRNLDPEFLDAVVPSLVILYAGQAERDKPSADLLQALGGRAVLRTDERGTIELSIGADGAMVRTER